jgi:hypothetical protein
MRKLVEVIKIEWLEHGERRGVVFRLMTQPPNQTLAR